VVAEFDSDELIFRRVRADDIKDSEVLPTAFDWPAPSVLRSKFAEPHHAIHVSCCDGKQLPPGKWGVVEVRLRDLPTPFQSGQGKTFHFFIRHKPTPTCFAHSELLCRADDDPPEAEKQRPSNSIRILYLIELAKRASVRVPPVDIS